MATNDTYNFYDQSRLVRIDHVDNFNELINFTRNQASQDDVCEADFGEVVEENSDTDDKSKEEVAKVTAAGSTSFCLRFPLPLCRWRLTRVYCAPVCWTSPVSVTSPGRVCAA